MHNFRRQVQRRWMHTMEFAPPATPFTGKRTHHHLKKRTTAGGAGAFGALAMLVGCTLGGRYLVKRAERRDARRALVYRLLEQQSRLVSLWPHADSADVDQSEIRLGAASKGDGTAFACARGVGVACGAEASRILESCAVALSPIGLADVDTSESELYGQKDLQHAKNKMSFERKLNSEATSNSDDEVERNHQRAMRLAAKMFDLRRVFVAAIEQFVDDDDETQDPGSSHFNRVVRDSSVSLLSVDPASSNALLVLNHGAHVIALLRPTASVDGAYQVIYRHTGESAEATLGNTFALDDIAESDVVLVAPTLPDNAVLEQRVSAQLLGRTKSQLRSWQAMHDAAADLVNSLGIEQVSAAIVVPRRPL